MEIQNLITALGLYPKDAKVSPYVQHRVVFGKSDITDVGLKVSDKEGEHLGNISFKK